MIKVRCDYINEQNKRKEDYFIFTDIEVIGHAEKSGYTNNIRVCAGVSAICYGINRLIDSEQFVLEYDVGYFHCYTTRTKDLRHILDKDSVYALNTLVCQLFEIYNKYPTSFKSFELVDVKEKYEDGKNNQPRKRRKKGNRRVGLYSTIESPYLEEN